MGGSHSKPAAGNGKNANCSARATFRRASRYSISSCRGRAASATSCSFRTTWSQANSADYARGCGGLHGRKRSGAEVLGACAFGLCAALVSLHVAAGAADFKPPAAKDSRGGEFQPPTDRPPPDVVRAIEEQLSRLAPAG